MATNNALIDEVVRRVMEHLRSQPVGVRDEQPTPNAGTIVIEDRVVTESVLRSRLNGAARVQLHSKSVMTPSAIDFLRQQGICWTRCSEQSAPAGTQARWIAIVLEPTTIVSAALADMESGGVAFREEVAGSVDEAIEQIRTVINQSDASGVAVFATEAEVITCLANRDERVRAFAAGNGDRSRAVIEHLKPNVMCIDPAGLSFVEIRNLLRTFTGSAKTEASR